MKKMILVLLSAMILALAGCGEIEKLENTIVLGEGNWDSFTFHNQVVKFILVEGYNKEVDVVPADTTLGLAGLIGGDIDVYLELWSDNLATYKDDIATGKYLELSVNFDDNAQGIYIPRYLQEQYPDLISVQDLERYPELFPNPEGGSKGIIYGGTEGWSATAFLREKITNYGLDEYYVFKTIDSTDILNATLLAAYQKEEPWVGYNWEPTWIIGLLDMILLEDTTYSPEAFAIGEGSFPSVRVTVTSNPALKDDHPEVYTFLTNYETSSELTSQALAYMQENDVEADIAAIYFLESNTDLWKDWVSEEAYDNIIDALSQK